VRRQLLLAGGLIASLALGLWALPGRTVDLSTGRTYTLSPDTTQFLAGLDRDVAIEVFYANDQPGYADVAALVHRFDNASDRVSAVFQNPDGERAIALRVASGAVAVTAAAGQPVVIRNPEEADLAAAVAEAIGEPPPRITPNVAPSQPLLPSPLGRALLFWAPVVIAPLLVVGLGISIAIRRRADSDGSAIGSPATRAA
jgi:hypothetical protein